MDPPSSTSQDEDHRVLEFPGRGGTIDLQHVFMREKGRLLQFLKIRLGSEAEAQDASQLAFLRLWQRRHLLHGENVPSLLYVTARNIAVDMLRERTRVLSACRGGTWEEVAEVQDPAAGPERILSARQDLRRVLDLIEHLPRKCRTAFVNYYFDQLTYEEIADQMDLSESMVRKYVIRAIAYCASHFESEEC